MQRSALGIQREQRGVLGLRRGDRAVEIGAEINLAVERHRRRFDLTAAIVGGRPLPPDRAVVEIERVHREAAADIEPVAIEIDEGRADERVVTDARSGVGLELPDYRAIRRIDRVEVLVRRADIDYLAPRLGAALAEMLEVDDDRRGRDRVAGVEHPLRSEQADGAAVDLGFVPVEGCAVQIVSVHRPVVGIAAGCGNATRSR